MAGVGDVGTSSFEFYEGIRIVIPGFFAFAAYAAVSATLDSSAKLPDISALGAVLGILSAGLLLYFVDAPAKAVAHRKGLPSDLIQKDWKITLAQPVSTLNMFFVMVDATMPAPIRARGLYKGSIYKIGYEAIVIASFGALVVGLGQVARLGGKVDSDLRPRVVLVALAGGLLVLAVPLATLFGWLRDRHRSRVAYPSIAPSVGDMATIMLSLALIAAYAGSDDAWILMLAASAVSYAHFLVRMHRGMRMGPRSFSPILWRWVGNYLSRVGSPRESVSPAFLCFPLVLALTPPYLAMASRGLPPAASWSALSAWLAVSISVVTLLIARGHEKGLHGAYATQKAWMQANKERLVKEYFSPAVFGLPDPNDLRSRTYL